MNEGQETKTQSTRQGNLWHLNNDDDTKKKKNSMA
jgi:hypothetical protein